MLVVQKSPISLIDFQDSIREWYAQKSREFTSSQYQENESSRQFFVEDRFEKLEHKFARERLRLHHQFSQISKCSATTKHSNSAALKRLASSARRVETLPKTDYIKKHLSGYHRFEPTPELRPEYILFGILTEEVTNELEDVPFPDLNVVHEECKQKFFDDLHTKSTLPCAAADKKPSINVVKEEGVLSNLLASTPTAFPTAPSIQKRGIAFTTPAKNPPLFANGESNSNATKVELLKKGDVGDWNFCKTSTPLGETSKIPDFTFRPSDYGISSSATASPAASRLNIEVRGGIKATDQNGSTFFTTADETAQKSSAANATEEKNSDYVSVLSVPPSMAKSEATSELTKTSIEENHKPKAVSDEGQQHADEIFDVNFLHGCALAKWIQYFTTYNTDLMASVEAFERDTSQKQFRFALKRTIVDKINFSAKKKASNVDLAQVLSFFLSLFDFKAVSDSEGNEMQINAENKAMMNYAMFTISSRYIEQIKWDMDLMDTVVLVLVSICLKSKGFYKVFCAVILSSSVLLRMSISRIMDKALSFGRQPPEAAVLWISTERAVFNLFVRVHLTLKSTRTDGGATPQSLRGPALLHLILENVLALQTPVFCSSAFIVAELINTCLRQIIRASCKDGASRNEALSRWSDSAKRICDYDWNRVLELISSRLKDENLEIVLHSRHDALLCVLKHSVEQELKIT